MSPPVAPTRAVRGVTVAAVLLVAVVAAVVSYAHMHTVADRAGEGWRAWLVPLSVDGLVVAASMVLLTRRRAGLPGGWLAWCALLGGVGASLAANVAAAEPTTTARVVAAWPAVAFAVGIELLLSQRQAPGTVDLSQQFSTSYSGTEYPSHPVGEDVGDAAPTGRPVGEVRSHDDTAPGDDERQESLRADLPEALSDPLSARLAELVDAARAEGRTVGRRTVARELQVTEYRAGQLLARASNGTAGGAR